MEFELGKTYRGIDSDSTYRGWIYTCTGLTANETTGVWISPEGKVIPQGLVPDKFKMFMEPIDKTIKEEKKEEIDLWNL